MCLLVFAWKAHPRYRLVMAANRDEFHDRPAAPLGGGRTRREFSQAATCAAAARGWALPRRAASPWSPTFANWSGRAAGRAVAGPLVHGFLAGTDAPAEYLERAATRRPRITPASTCSLGDVDELHYYSNRNGRVAAPARRRACYGLSNHWLDSPWPKLLRTRARLRRD